MSLRTTSTRIPRTSRTERSVLTVSAQDFEKLVNLVGWHLFTEDVFDGFTDSTALVRVSSPTVLSGRVYRGIKLERY